MAVAVLVSAAASAAAVDVAARDHGTFDVLVDGHVWLPAGGAVEVTRDGRRFSAEDGSLSLDTKIVDSGRDGFGCYRKVGARWRAGEGILETSARVYDDEDAVVFSERFVTAFEGTGGWDLAATFPSFTVSPDDNHNHEYDYDHRHRRGFLQFAGAMLGAHYRTGPWGSAQGLGPGGSGGTGPLVLFLPAHGPHTSSPTGSRRRRSSRGGSPWAPGTCTVLSPASNFMAVSQATRGDVLAYGPVGNFTSLPSGFELEVIIAADARGINRCMMRWGDLLLQRYGKSRFDAWTRDPTLQLLGYSTDNGAFYYYHTLAANASYEDTMLAVHRAAQTHGLPMRYWLADSWWYYKGKAGGVRDWRARPDVFPHGLQAVHARTGWGVQAHNRYWSADTVYSPAYDFAFSNAPGDPPSPLALPVSQRFWDDLMANATDWGMVVYEQDWLDTQWDLFPPLQRNATLGSLWLRQLGAAAERTAVSVQMCMSYPRHALASLELKAVTQARASEDYAPGLNDQWRPLGTTGLLALALGLAPSKDSFWSGREQPGNPYALQEPFARLQAAVATLAKGPVAVSDGVCCFDKALIMRSATAAGVLLQPGRPVTKLDRALEAEALAGGGREGSTGVGEVWAADTTVAGRRYAVILAAEVAAPLDLFPADLGYDDGVDAPALVVVEANRSSEALPFGAHKPLSVPQNSKLDFGVWSVSPRERNGWALLGEVATKWTAVSRARFTNVASQGDAIRAEVRGAPGEVVSVGFCPPSEPFEPPGPPAMATDAGTDTAMGGVGPDSQASLAAAGARTTALSDAPRDTEGAGRGVDSQRPPGAQPVLFVECLLPAGGVAYVHASISRGTCCSAAVEASAAGCTWQAVGYS